MFDAKPYQHRLHQLLQALAIAFALPFVGMLMAYRYGLSLPETQFLLAIIGMVSVSYAFLRSTQLLKIHRKNFHIGRIISHLVLLVVMFLWANLAANYLLTPQWSMWLWIATWLGSCIPLVRVLDHARCWLDARRPIKLTVDRHIVIKGKAKA